VGEKGVPWPNKQPELELIDIAGSDVQALPASWLAICFPGAGLNSVNVHNIAHAMGVFARFGACKRGISTFDLQLVARPAKCQQSPPLGSQARCTILC
jgi:hypothetical protein